MGKYKGFTQVELRKPKRSMFDLSHESRVSSRMGKLTPILMVETLPNDTFRVSSEVLIKLAPMIAPIFHRLNLYVHYFFVPNRLLWEDWEEFITGGRLGAAIDVPPVPPAVEIADVLATGQSFLANGSLADYLGVPGIPDATVGYTTQTIDLMPFAAYQKVFMDYYRDRNFVPDDFYTAAMPLPSGVLGMGDLFEYFTQRQRAWQHDYFTSAQTTTQRGSEVLMPLQGSITDVRNLDGSLPDPNKYLATSDGIGITAGKLIETAFPAPTDAEAVELQFSGSDVTINEFRRSIALQQWLERNQLAGSRYNESIWAHFNRRTSDGRLQRAEYLGGGKAVVKIDEVMTTAYSEDADTNLVPPANPTGRGSAYSTTNSFTYNCEEHGFVIGILSVMPSTGYMQGMPRMFTQRHSFLDYPWPTFANLGEQPVYDYEIYADPTSLANSQAGAADEAAIFGYQSRYSDWKHMESTAHGDFRDTLDFWHLTRKFSSQPNLDYNFVRMLDEEQDRIFNVTGVDTLWMYIYNQVKVVRSLPYFGVPSGLYPSAV